MRAHEHRSPKGARLTGVLVHTHLVFVEIEDQLHGAVRQKALLRVPLGVTLVVPELIDEVRQRCCGNVTAKAH